MSHTRDREGDRFFYKYYYVIKLRNIQFQPCFQLVGKELCAIYNHVQLHRLHHLYHLSWRE